MAMELRRSGHDVEVVTAFPNYPKGKVFEGYSGFYRLDECNGIRVHRVWLHAAMGGGIGRMLNYASFTATSFYGLFKSKRPDYLFVESPPLSTSIPGYIASRLWGVPYIFNVADLWPEAIVENGFISKGLTLKILLVLERWSYRKAAYVNAVTDGIRNALLHAKKLSAEKVLLLPNGADTRQYQPRDQDLELKKELGLEKKRIILWAGTLGVAHGLEFVLEAAKLLKDDKDIHFLFVGDGSSRKKLEHLKERLRLQNVTFRDPVSIEELPPYFSIAECGLASLRALATHEGARPSKIFPVLASGRPVIFVGQGECARLVEEAQAGIVVPPENPEALASAIRALFGQAGKIEELGRNGRRFVEENYDWSNLVASWVSQLRRPGLQTQAGGNPPVSGKEFRPTAITE